MYNRSVHLTKLVTFLNKVCIFYVTNYNNIIFFREHEALKGQKNYRQGFTDVSIIIR